MEPGAPQDVHNDTTSGQVKKSRYATLTPLQTRHYWSAGLLWRHWWKTVYSLLFTRPTGAGFWDRYEQKDVPQNNPYLGRGKKQTMTSGWRRVTVTVIWGHNKWLWGMINCYCVGHICFTETVQLLHVYIPNLSRWWIGRKFSFWLNMKMCLAAVLKGNDWGWWCVWVSVLGWVGVSPRTQCFPRRARPGS